MHASVHSCSLPACISAHTKASWPGELKLLSLACATHLPACLPKLVVKQLAVPARLAGGAFNYISISFGELAAW